VVRGAILDPDSARLVLQVVRYLKQSGFVIGRPGRGSRFTAPETMVFVRNDSGEEIPAFGCMQVNGTVEAGGQNYLKVVKPADTTGKAGKYLFNDLAPIEIGGYGLAQSRFVHRALTNGDTITLGAKWAPIASSWEVGANPAGQFTAVGADDIVTDCIRLIDDSPTVVHAVTPEDGIPARSGGTMGSASCDIYKCSSAGVLSDSGLNETVYNMASAAIAELTYIVAMRNDAGLLVAIVEDCGGL